MKLSQRSVDRVTNVRYHQEMIRTRSFVILFGLFGLAGSGCGVKGSPLPPEDPPVLGRGDRAYSKSVRDLPRQKDPESEKKKEESAEER